MTEERLSENEERPSDIIDIIDTIAKADGATLVVAALAVDLGDLPVEHRSEPVIKLFRALDAAIPDQEFVDLVGDVLLVLARRVQWGMWDQGLR